MAQVTEIRNQPYNWAQNVTPIIQSWTDYGKYMMERKQKEKELVALNALQQGYMIPPKDMQMNLGGYPMQSMSLEDILTLKGKGYESLKDMATIMNLNARTQASQQNAALVDQFMSGGGAAGGGWEPYGMTVSQSGPSLQFVPSQAGGGYATPGGGLFGKLAARRATPTPTPQPMAAGPQSLSSYKQSLLIEAKRRRPNLPLEVLLEWVNAQPEEETE